MVPEKLIMEIRDLEMILNEKRWELQRYCLIDQEYTRYGGNYLIKKYNNNLTYVYKYLNSNAYQDAVASHHFVKHKYDHKQRALLIITFFSPDKDLIDPRYYTSEEEREWNERRQLSTGKQA